VCEEKSVKQIFYDKLLALFKRTWTSSTEGTALDLIERETTTGQITKE